jgi:hypothetical protein
MILPPQYPDPEEIRRQIQERLERNAAWVRFDSRSEMPPLQDTLGEANRRRVGRATADIGSLRIGDVGDFRKVAAALVELSQHISTIAVPAVRRANEPARMGQEGASSSFLGDQRIAHVNSLVSKARKTSVEVKNSLEAVARSLTRTARVVQRVGEAFAEVRDLNAARLRAMNQQFTSSLPGADQRRPG